MTVTISQSRYYFMANPQQIVISPKFEMRSEKETHRPIKHRVSKISPFSLTDNNHLEAYPPKGNNWQSFLQIFLNPCMYTSNHTYQYNHHYQVQNCIIKKITSFPQSTEHYSSSARSSIINHSNKNLGTHAIFHTAEITVTLLINKSKHQTTLIMYFRVIRFSN